VVGDYLKRWAVELWIKDEKQHLARLLQLRGDLVRKSFVFKGGVGEIAKT
jgi:hypothetical protein